MEVKIVGSIQFKNRTLPVYGNLDEPLFKATGRGRAAELWGQQRLEPDQRL